MKSLLIVVACAGILMGEVRAADKAAKRPVFNHRLSAAESVKIPRRPYLGSPDTLHILVALVEFKPESTSLTTGSGTFVLAAPNKPYIDSPPHNRSYFLNHIAFVQNYFRKVSRGNQFIAATLLDSVYKLGSTMRTYSPVATGGTTNIGLGNLMKDAWTLIDSTTAGVNFDNYDAFVIFHAGVGHDIDFVSLYGYDPTPYDLPSLYISLPALQKMYGASYGGIPVSNGTHPITNSMILPETENRILATVGGQSLLQLSINGLFAASIGSHLGLPDLFDTQSGASGIGRFGLMDGQAIFGW
ncbi:MAG TPA: hypothetical protein VKS81_04180, partial [Bacteroidota bacterium]|nr:hypothetical protein [Bacteroidota bacterium]